jgi:hypothetical protein
MSLGHVYRRFIVGQVPRGAASAVNPPSLSTYAKASVDTQLRRVLRWRFALAVTAPLSVASL